MYIMDHIGYHSQKLFARARNHLHMLTVPKSEAKIKKFWKQPWDSQGNGQFTTESQGRIRTLDGDPRTRTFHLMRVTAGDTVCTVNGVLTRACIKRSSKEFTSLLSELLCIHNQFFLVVVSYFLVTVVISYL